MSVRFQTVDEAADGQRLDNYLLKHLKGVPKSHIYRVIRKGEVRVNKGRKKAQYKLKDGDVVRIPPIRTASQKPISASNQLTDTLKKSIIFEDDGLIALNKPSGIAVHGGSGISTGLIEALRQLYKQPLELVHRIDRATSGILLVAKKRSVLKNLHQQLTQHQIEKRYIALVEGAWSKKRHSIDAPLSHNSRNAFVDAQGKEAISHFHPVKNFNTEDGIKASLVEVLIETGRMHQIRAHAKHAKHPIAGDEKYGDKQFNQLLKNHGLGRLFLHAKQITFTNPTSDGLEKITAPLPADLQQLIERL